MKAADPAASATTPTTSAATSPSPTTATSTFQLKHTNGACRSSACVLWLTKVI